MSSTVPSLLCLGIEMALGLVGTAGHYGVLGTVGIVGNSGRGIRIIWIILTSSHPSLLREKKWKKILSNFCMDVWSCIMDLSVDYGRKIDECPPPFSHHLFGTDVCFCQKVLYVQIIENRNDPEQQEFF